MERVLKMSDLDEALNDPEFAKLPLGKQLEISRQLDPEFAGLSPKDQGTVLHKNKLKVLNIKQEETPIEDKGFLATLGEEIPSGIYNTFRHPIETGKGIFKSQMEEFGKSDEEFKHGNYIPSAGHYLAGLLPISGPLAAKGGEELGAGQYGQGSAHVLESLLPFILKNAPKVPGAGIVPAALKGGFKEAISPIEMGPGSMRYNIPGGKTLGGATLGGFAGSPFEHFLPGSRVVGATIGGTAPFIKGAYQGAREFLQRGKPYNPEPFIRESGSPVKTQFGGSYEPDIKAKPGTQLSRGKFEPAEEVSDYKFKVNPKTKSLVKGSSSTYDPIGEAKPGKVLSRKLNDQEVVELTKVVRDSKTGKFKSRKISGPEE
jgi:hypothetical protein